MNGIKILPAIDYGTGFIPAEFIPKGGNEYWHRDSIAKHPAKGWRHLKASEIETLVKNGNTCSEWDDFWVSDPFRPELIKNSNFAGFIRLGALDAVVLEHHDLQLSSGITNSTIISCDFGDNCAVHDCSYIAHYVVGNYVILSNNHEIHVSNHAKFGNGILMEGEREDIRVWIDVMNEAGGRSILAFDGITTADAYIWATRREDAGLMDALKRLTQEQFDPRRGKYGEIGSWSVIRSNHIVKDVKIGECAYVKGANKLKNLTINSSSTEPSQIGEGVELVNGIIGYGCRIFYGCKAVRFVLGNNSNLKYGARLIHSFLGDNSTVSCCELLNNLIFPAHEQHHNNSFLIAGLIQGQSNIAAGATLGSNHNSRANDGEIRAERGFWPGLCVTIKHFSRFAAFTMLAKADYKNELDIRFPFSLVSDNESAGRLEIMPAYWWMYNMYALMRTPVKLSSRDKRVTKTQNIEFDPFAPDTIEEILAARALLERAVGIAALKTEGAQQPGALGKTPEEVGKKLLSGSEQGMEHLVVHAEGAENSKRKVLILKPWKAWRSYGDMLVYYSVKTLIPEIEKNPADAAARFATVEFMERETSWENAGGQIVPTKKMQALIEAIKSGEYKSWIEVHGAWDQLSREYATGKLRHAICVLRELTGTPEPGNDKLADMLFEFLRIVKYTSEQVLLTRKKDYDNPFRNTTFRSESERDAVLGKLADNPFIKEYSAETEKLALTASRLIERLNP